MIVMVAEKLPASVPTLVTLTEICAGSPNWIQSGLRVKSINLKLAGLGTSDCTNMKLGTVMARRIKVETKIILSFVLVDREPKMYPLARMKKISFLVFNVFVNPFLL